MTQTFLKKLPKNNRISSLYLLIRYNSAYTINYFLLGVFESKELAEESRSIYINKRLVYDLYAKQAYHTVDLNEDLFISDLEDVELDDKYAKIWIEYTEGFGQGMISFHNSEMNIESESTFFYDKAIALYEINKLYDELGEFSDKLPDKNTQNQIDDHKDYIDDPY